MCACRRVSYIALREGWDTDLAVSPARVFWGGVRIFEWWVERAQRSECFPVAEPSF
jgi:hypothetical protein